MEQTTNKPNDKEKKASFGTVVADHKAEFKRITWPKKDDVVKKTTTVVVTSLIIAAIVLTYDAIYTSLIDLAMNALGLL